jgi:hypothetical protein
MRYSVFVLAIALALGSIACLANSGINEKALVESEANWARKHLLEAAAALSHPAFSIDGPTLKNVPVPSRLSDGSGVPFKHWIPAMLASVEAGKNHCQSLSGPCQDKAAEMGAKQSVQVFKSARPGALLRAILEEPAKPRADGRSFEAP